MNVKLVFNRVTQVLKGKNNSLHKNKDKNVKYNIFSRFNIELTIKKGLLVVSTVFK